MGIFNFFFIYPLTPKITLDTYRSNGPIQYPPSNLSGFKEDSLAEHSEESILHKNLPGCARASLRSARPSLISVALFWCIF